MGTYINVEGFPIDFSQILGLPNLASIFWKFLLGKIKKFKKKNPLIKLLNQIQTKVLLSDSLDEIVNKPEEEFVQDEENLDRYNEIRNLYKENQSEDHFQEINDIINNGNKPKDLDSSILIRGDWGFL